MVFIDDYLETEGGDKLSLVNVISDSTDVFEEVRLKELREKLAQAFEKLSKQERIILSLYYYEDMNMKEIARILDLSLSRVSQIHGKALLKLKNFIETD